MAKRTTARKLIKQWGVKVKHGLYHKDSNWYHLLTDFPAALFDPKGYVVLRQRSPIATVMLCGLLKQFMLMMGFQRFRVM